MVGKSLESKVHGESKGFLQNKFNWARKGIVRGIASGIFYFLVACGGGGGDSGGTPPKPPIETVATETSDTSGEAYFYDEIESTDVTINVKDQNDNPLSNIPITFWNTDKFKFYFGEDPSGQHQGIPLVKSHNSEWNYPMFLNGELPQLYDFSINSEDGAALNESIQAVVDNNQDCYNDTPQGLVNTIGLQNLAGQIRNPNGLIVYTFASGPNQLEDILNETGLGNTENIKTCVGIPVPEDQGGGSILRVYTFTKDDSGIPMCTDGDGDGYFAQGGSCGPADCNDDPAFGYAINPGAQEVLDGIDNNCDGKIDEGLIFDADGDGYNNTIDCDDNDPDKYPGAPELCDRKDNQCLGDPGYGEIDEGCSSGIDKIAYVSQNEVYVKDLDAGVQVPGTRITFSGAGNYSIDPSWIGNSAFVFVTNMFDPTRSNPGEIARKDLGGGNPVGLTNDNFSDFGPSVSSNGWVAFGSLRDGGNDSEIYKMRVSDGSEKTKLTNNNYDDLWPSWFSDGTRLVASRRIGIYKLAIFNSDGTGDYILNPNSTLSHRYPSVSPDGDLIASNALAADGYQQIYLTDLSGNETQITFDSYNHSHPTWSSDGRISYASDKDGKNNIEIINSDGTGKDYITDDSNFNYNPAISK